MKWTFEFSKKAEKQWSRLQKHSPISPSIVGKLPSQQALSSK